MLNLWVGALIRLFRSRRNLVLENLAPRQQLTVLKRRHPTMRDEQRTTRILSELKALGVRLSIDDFGTGYSSLSYLRRFALDILKIDRSFISEMLTNSESLEIVKTILSLGNNLGMEVVAEGVETLEQMSVLKSLGCEYAQGYFFSKPVDSAGILRTLLTAEANSYTLPQASPKQLVGPVG